MADKNPEPIPESIPAAVTAFTLKGMRYIPGGVRSFWSTYLIGISPAVPYFITDGVAGVSLKRVAISSGLLAYIFGLITLAVWSWCDDTLVPYSDDILQSGEDFPNIANYAAIVPAYVVLSSCLIVTVMRSESRLGRQVSGERESQYWWVRPLGVAFTVFVSARLISQYFSEITSPSVYEDTYWFLYPASAGGLRPLRPIGVYFVILNFCLLVLAITAILSYVIIAVRMYEVGSKFQSGTDLGVVDNDAFDDLLRDFTASYILAKLLAACFILNYWTWLLQAPKGSVNLSAMHVALMLIGCYFIAVPRMWVELQWYWHRSRIGKADWHSVKRGWRFWLCSALDVLVFSQFAFIWL